MKQIISSQGDPILVDDDVYEWLAALKWTVRRTTRRTLYAKTTFRDADGKQQNVLMHRMILGVQDGMVVDHIDHNGLNNQRHNLRVCTPKENARNSLRKRGSLTPKGVFFVQRDRRYQAAIYIDGKRVYLGSYLDPLEAAHAYNRAAIKYFGEFAALNPY